MNQFQYNSFRGLSYIGIMVDLAGCPNRCRHCWLGAQRNAQMNVDEFKEIAGQFKNWRDDSGKGIGAFSFFSWWREPDYRDDYRELWQLERELSSPGCARRFELLSTWRLARDERYATWAATLPTVACQISFAGMAENTDWFMRRKGAFQDQLQATERLLKAGIAPRWQLFITKRSLGELEDFLRLIDRLEMHRRCEDIGRKFKVFIGGMSPEGGGYDLENIRPEEQDLQRIPQALVDVSRDGIALLGRPEYELLETLKDMDNPPDIRVAEPCLAVNADYDVYPNLAEPAEWWRLGNLKTDGVDRIIKAYLNETTTGMRANRTIPVSVLAGRYGDRKSRKLYDGNDLVCRFLHQWGTDYRRESI